MRLTVAVAVSCLLLTSLSAAQHASAAIRKETHIPPQSLDSALQTFAEDRNLQLVYATDEVGGLQTSGAAGNLTAGDVLKQLLEGTGLSYQFLDDNTVTIAPTVPASSVSAGYSAQMTQRAKSSDDGGKNSDNEASQKDGLWDRFRLAQVNQGASSSSRAFPAPPDESVTLEEVVVTAQKKEERLRDVPIPVSVVDADRLTQTGQVLLRDYYSSVPSMNLVVQNNGTSNLFIRGIASVGGNPTVGIMIDGVPFGGSTSLTGSGDLPDFDPGDLDRVEVLRGPQGTLYGASSLGGLVNYVTQDPSTAALTGRVELGVSGIQNGSSLGYTSRGSANVPLTDSLAMRASAFVRGAPGYIDDPTLNMEGVNKDKAYGGHLSLLWRPSEDFSLKLSAFVQAYKADGVSEITGPGEWEQNYIPGVPGIERTNQAYSAIATQKLGSFELTSVTGYNSDINRVGDDYSSVFGAPTLFTGGTNAARKVSEELRLLVPIGTHLEWLLGAFYTHERYTEPSDLFYSVDPISGERLGESASYGYVATLNEYAGFTDLTFHFTSQFDVQIGARESRIKQGSEQTRPVNVQQLGSDQSAFTYLLTPRYRFSPDLMAYARLASGYRAGGSNLTLCVQDNIPCTYNPDKTKNYEIGLKADLLGHTLSIDSSLYYIDWKDIQIQSIVGFDGYTANGGAGKSEGVELSVESKPVRGLVLAAWLDYDNAVLTQDLPASSTSYGRSGDRLPGSSRFSGHLSLTQELPLTGRTTAFVGGQVSYIGDIFSSFAPTDPSSPCAPCLRQRFPTYAKTDLRTGIRYDSWTLNFFVNNLTDKRAVVGGGLGFVPPTSFIYITPRTVGLSVTKLFD